MFNIKTSDSTNTGRTPATLPPPVKEKLTKPTDFQLLSQVQDRLWRRKGQALLKEAPPTKQQQGEEQQKGKASENAAHPQ
jgi:hypothetical protein